jgi:hypothetical protein
MMSPYRAPSWAIGQGAPPAAAQAARALAPDRRAVVNLGLIGAGVAMGLIAYPHVRKPLGAIALGASGSLVAVGLTFILLDLLGVPTPPATVV